MDAMRRSWMWGLPLLLTLSFTVGCDGGTGNTLPDGGSQTDGGNSAGGDGGTNGDGGTQGGTDAGTADFSLSLTPAAVALAPRGDTTLTVNLSREEEAVGDIALTLENAPQGVTGTFSPNPADGDASQLTLQVGANVPAGNHTLTVVGTLNGLRRATALELTVTEPATLLLVDDDGSPNNQGETSPTPSPSDILFRQLLQGRPYNTYVVPLNANGPSEAQLQGYTTVVWYTGEQYGGTGNAGTVSSADEFVLQAFLDAGDRQLLLFSDEYVWWFNGEGMQWDAEAPDFVSNIVGLKGARADALNGESFIAAGFAGTLAADKSYRVAADTPLPTWTALLNPAPGTTPLLTVTADGNGDGEAEAGVAVATERKGVGTAGTSRVVLVGFTFENIVDLGGRTRQELFNLLLGGE